MCKTTLKLSVRCFMLDDLWWFKLMRSCKKCSEIMVRDFLFHGSDAHEPLLGGLRTGGRLTLSPASCSSAQLLAPGTLCREQARQCDLPEFCTGKSPQCPTNFYQMDGTPCEDGQAYCYNGMCLTYQEQCQQLWGPGKALSSEQTTLLPPRCFLASLPLQTLWIA